MPQIKKIALTLAFTAGLAGCQETGIVTPTDAAGRPLSPDQISSVYSQRMRDTFNAYVQTHGLDATQPLPRNLTIPWISLHAHDTTYGYIVMIGAMTPAGCQRGVAIELNDGGGRYGHPYRRQYSHAFCAPGHGRPQDTRPNVR